MMRQKGIRVFILLLLLTLLLAGRVSASVDGGTPPPPVINPGGDPAYLHLLSGATSKDLSVGDSRTSILGGDLDTDVYRHAQNIYSSFNARIQTLESVSNLETVIASDYTVSGAETWTVDNSPYVIQGHLTIAATGQLTITAGVEVQIAAARSFLVRSGGQLNVLGTTVDPVRITSISEHFTGLVFEENAHVHLFQCDIGQAGAAGAAALSIYGSDVSIDHCTIHDNGVGSARAVYLIGSG
ncbi:MAG: hypothetical protein PVG14_15485, partial [Anaerolineales bacterium]